MNGGGGRGGGEVTRIMHHINGSNFFKWFTPPPPYCSMIKKNICFEVCHTVYICTVSALVPFIHNLGEERGNVFSLQRERESRRKNCSSRMKSKEKVAEGKGFPFAEKESRNKIVPQE
jgi:hypothetical protein